MGLVIRYPCYFLYSSRHMGITPIDLVKYELVHKLELRSLGARDENRVLKGLFLS